MFQWFWIEKGLMFFAQNFESPATVLRNIFYITFLMLLKKKMYIKVIRDRERYKIKEG